MLRKRGETRIKYWSESQSGKHWSSRWRQCWTVIFIAWRIWGTSINGTRGRPTIWWPSNTIDWCLQWISTDCWWNFGDYFRSLELLSIGGTFWQSTNWYRRIILVIERWAFKFCCCPFIHLEDMITQDFFYKAVQPLDRIPPLPKSSTTFARTSVWPFFLEMSAQFKSQTNVTDAANQKARRRRETLFKKASEYSSECAADIHLILRMKNTGQIYIMTSISEGWPLSQDQLVSPAIY